MLVLPSFLWELNLENIGKPRRVWMPHMALKLHLVQLQWNTKDAPISSSMQGHTTVADLWSLGICLYEFAGSLSGECDEMPWFLVDFLMIYGFYWVLLGDVCSFFNMVRQSGWLLVWLLVCLGQASLTKALHQRRWLHQCCAIER